ncbi:type II secretion system secretin GspD [Myxococcota bacterium]|nr:type II secretion system secretin GspD [Myxococcota bacterium]
MPTPARSLLLPASLLLGMVLSGPTMAAGPAAHGPPAPQDDESDKDAILRRAAGGAGSKNAPAAAEDEGGEADGGGDATSSSTRGKPPILTGRSTQVTIDFVDTPITDLIKYFAEITGRNFLLTEELKGEVTIISHKPVSVGEAYEAFLSALESAGYTTVTVGQLTKVVATGEAASSPLNEYYQGNIPYTDNYVTQIIQLENVAVGDVSSVVKELAGAKAKVIAYSPTNTLIITDSAVNIRRVYRIVSQLDVAAPKSGLRIFPIRYAQAAEIQKVITEIYGAEASSASSSTSAGGTSARNNRRTARRATEAPAAADAASSTTVGKEGSFIQKIISDERTNSVIVLANDEAMLKIEELIAQLDIDVDPQSRAQIKVVYLEHAKAEDVAQVLSNLSENSSRASSSTRTAAGTRGAANTRNLRAGADGAAPAGAAGDDDGSAVAALDGGTRITSDENTNSLVIVATPDQFQVLEQVIKQLDIRRQQVFVQAVILEMAGEDTFELGLGLHGGIPGEDGGLQIGSAQLGGSSLGLSTEALSGLAVGVYGKTIEVPLSGLSGSESTTLAVPAFGIALNALASNSAVNIVATPEILTMDNEEAKIVVGRNVPFPVSSGRDNNNNPIISYQREDVATTLKVTPQINESNFVTLELFQEVTEVEEDDSGLDVTTAGFITSKRSAETVVVVQDNQTVVIGGLIGSTDTQVETKIPILGDLPLIGNLFRGKRDVSRKTNLLIFLTPHIIEEPADLEEVYRIKWAQREEFIRRFYGKSREEQEAQIQDLLRFSMNRIDEPSPWRTKPPKGDTSVIIGPTSDSAVIEDVTETSTSTSASGAEPTPEVSPEATEGADTSRELEP